MDDKPPKPPTPGDRPPRPPTPGDRPPRPPTPGDRPPTPPPSKAKSYKKQKSWPSKATTILGFMHHDHKDKLEVEVENGEKEVFKRDELAHSHKTATADYKEIQRKIKETRSILQALCDSAGEVVTPCLCCCANSELQLIIEECLDAYTRRVETFKGDDPTDTDEKTQLMSTLGRLREHARRYSIAEQTLTETKKKYAEMSLEMMHKELSLLHDDITRAKEKFNVEKKKIDQLRKGFTRCKHAWFFLRPFKFIEIIDEATVDCLKD